MKRICDIEVNITEHCYGITELAIFKQKVNHVRWSILPEWRKSCLYHGSADALLNNITRLMGENKRKC